MVKISLIVVLFIVLNIFLYRKLVYLNKNHPILFNLKLISGVYWCMNKLLQLYGADKVAITKIKIDSGGLIKQMVQEISVDDTPMIYDLKNVPIQQDEYRKIRLMDDRHTFVTYVEGIPNKHERSVLQKAGIKHVKVIKLIDNGSTSYTISVYFKKFDLKLNPIRKLCISSIIYTTFVLFDSNKDKL